jgi:acetolactate synthase-1/2/3 large subunit
MRDECNVTFAADAFARLTHRIGICDVTVGPGCLKLPSGLMEAYYSSIPILCIISELPDSWRHLYERGAALQAMEQEKLIAQFCKWVATLHSPAQWPTLLSSLLRRAVSGRPGPVALIIPQDVFDQAGSASNEVIDGSLGRFPLSRSSPAAADIERAAVLLTEAKCPVLITGGGVHIADAANEVRELAELLSMPVATTFSGRAVLPDNHPLSVGLLGNIGSGSARKAVEAADVVFLVGFKSGQNSTCNWTLPSADQTVIHLDLDPAEIGKVFTTEVGLVGDAQLGLRALKNTVKERVASPSRVEQIAAWRNGWLSEVGNALHSDAVPITPQRVMHELNQVARVGDTVCCDASYVTGWGMLFYQARRAGKVILAPRGSAGLGFGIPAAIGASCAQPDSTIWALCGDHGVSYSIGELATAVHCGLNIKVLVFNNQGSRWIDHYHRILFQGSGAPFRWGDTDFAAVGRGFGCFGVSVQQPQDIAQALRQAAEHQGPAVINLSVSGEETPVTSYERALRASRPS